MRKYLFRHKGLFVITAIMAILVRTIDVCIAFIFKYITDVAQTGDIEGYKIIVIVMVGYFILNSSMNISSSKYGNFKHRNNHISFFIRNSKLFITTNIWGKVK